MNTNTQTNTYEIKLQEDLSSSWNMFFETLEFRSEILNGQRSTILKGQLDQSALHGVLNQIRDLNLHLISVSTLSPVQTIKNVTPQEGISL